MSKNEKNVEKKKRKKFVSQKAVEKINFYS